MLPTVFSTPAQLSADLNRPASVCATVSTGVIAESFSLSPSQPPAQPLAWFSSLCR
jgi:hypothetical protein